MKKKYSAPGMEVVIIHGDNVILQASTSTSQLYTDEKKNPRDAMSRETLFDEEDEEW